MKYLQGRWLTAHGSKNVPRNIFIWPLWSLIWLESYGLFWIYIEDALCLSKHVSLSFLPLSLGDFFFALSSFTSGRPRSECRDTKGSVREREQDAVTRRPGANSGMFWEQSLGTPWDTLWGLFPSAAGRRWVDQELCIFPEPLPGQIHWGKGKKVTEKWSLWTMFPSSLWVLWRQARVFYISLSTPGPAV